MVPAKQADVIAAARAWLGTPYHHQASVRGAGCDCLGLARGVWRDVVGREPEAIPRYSPDWGEARAEEVLAQAASRWMIKVPSMKYRTGDLLLFRMRSRMIAKHCGILIAPDRFIHSYERLGVMEQPLTDAWRRRIAFVFRFPKGAS